MKRTTACCLLFLFVGCSGADESQDEVVADVNAPEDANAPDDVNAPDDTNVPEDTDAPDDGQSADTNGNPDEECTVHEDCVESQGVPAPPEVPCGSCYAVCENNACGTLCFEAAECVFTAGCGPNCEPLCNTTEDCFVDFGQICVDGICVYPDDT